MEWSRINWANAIIAVLNIYHLIAVNSCRNKRKYECRAAVSFSPVEYRLGGVGLGSGMTGKQGRAWVGAWVVHGVGEWGGAWVYGLRLLLLW